MGVGPDPKICRVCGWRRAVAGGRCHTCDVYYRRTGRERPEELVVAHSARINARSEAAAAFLDAIRATEDA